MASRNIGGEQTLENMLVWNSVEQNVKTTDYLLYDTLRWIKTTGFGEIKKEKKISLAISTLGTWSAYDYTPSHLGSAF